MRTISASNSSTHDLTNSLASISRIRCTLDGLLAVASVFLGWALGSCRLELDRDRSDRRIAKRRRRAPICVRATHIASSPARLPPETPTAILIADGLDFLDDACKRFGHRLKVAERRLPDLLGSRLVPVATAVPTAVRLAGRGLVDDSASFGPSAASGLRLVHSSG